MKNNTKTTDYPLFFPFQLFILIITGSRTISCRRSYRTRAHLCVRVLVCLFICLFICLFVCLFVSCCYCCSFFRFFLKLNTRKKGVVQFSTKIVHDDSTYRSSSTVMKNHVDKVLKLRLSQIHAKFEFRWSNRFLIVLVELLLVRRSRVISETRTIVFNVNGYLRNRCCLRQRTVQHQMIINE
jgi:hypothetical protein